MLFHSDGNNQLSHLKARLCCQKMIHITFYKLYIINDYHNYGRKHNDASEFPGYMMILLAKKRSHRHSDCHAGGLSKVSKWKKQSNKHIGVKKGSL